MSDNQLDRLHFRLAGIVNKLRERFPYPKTGVRQLETLRLFVDLVGVELQDIDNALYRLAQDRGETSEQEGVQEASHDVCSRCQKPLNNVSPGFGIVSGKLVCMPCLKSSGEQPEAIARSL